MISKDEHKTACSIDLYDWLLRHHPKQVEKKYDSLVLLYDRHVSVKKGYHGFLNWKTGEKGNNIDFLCNYLGYRYPHAVRALIDGMIVKQEQEVLPSKHLKEKPENEKLTLPVPEPGPYKKLYAFLIGRGIPTIVINTLINRRLIYQEASHGNIVFINPQGDYYEVRGTNTYADRRCKRKDYCTECVLGLHQWCNKMDECQDYCPNPYHGSSKELGNRFWYFDPHPTTVSEAVYITEAAIDAISLFCIHQKQGNTVPAVYVSIGGVSKQGKIDRLKKSGKAILAVDNDSAGEVCRERNRDIPSLVPKNKDWNDDLRKEDY